MYQEVVKVLRCGKARRA